MRFDTNERGEPRLVATAYTLTFLADRPYVRVEVRGRTLCTLFLLSGCQAVEGRDASSRLGTWTASPLGDGLRLEAEADSLFWRSKTYRFDCAEEGFDYGFVVEGSGSIDRVEYFSGHYSGSLRWSSGRFYSGFEVDAIFDPEPDVAEEPWFGRRERGLIDLSGVPIYGRDHWFFTPPPFCFVARSGDLMVSLGVKAEAGANRFSEYTWEGGTGQYLSLSYDGHTRVVGRYTLPSIAFRFGGDEYELLAAHAAELRDPALDARFKAPWWSAPIFCGWGAQCTIAGDSGERAPDLAREEIYRRLVAGLDGAGLLAGTLVIDDKWQKTYGRNDVDTAKWPDLKGFVGEMHKAGRKVLLWLKAWDPEGLEPELCVRDFAGKPIALDPTNPACRALFRERIAALLGPEGVDADGFKIDFSARIPVGPGCDLHGEAWGLELMRAYLELVYSEAKRAKRDALVMSHTPHPYLEDVTDMIRLNDVNGARPVVAAMTRRAKIARAACPSCLVDTDNWPMPDKASWLAWVRAQPGLGVPSLYYLWKIDGSGEAIGSAELDEIRALWTEYARTREAGPR